MLTGQFPPKQPKKREDYLQVRLEHYSLSKNKNTCLRHVPLFSPSRPISMSFSRTIFLVCWKTTKQAVLLRFLLLIYISPCSTCQHQKKYDPNQLKPYICLGRKKHH